MRLTHVNLFPKMKHFLVTAFACMTILAFSSAEPPCHIQEVFTCLNNEIDYLNSLPRRSLPKTNDDVEKFCKAMNDTLSCLSDFRKRCMTPIQNGIVDLAVEGMLDMRNQLCGNPQSALRTNYLAHAECLNKVSQGEGINNNLQLLLAMVERLLKLPNEQRLNYLCCGYAKMYHNIRSEAVNTCGEEAARAVEQFIELSVAQLPSVICNGYDGNSEECAAILPPDGSKPSEEFKENSIYKFIFSILKNYLE